MGSLWSHIGKCH